MSDDARFEDAAERPLRLRAEDAEDVTVLAALVQDAVLPANEMRWDRRKRRFFCLINRFRWEDKNAAAQRGHKFERVQSLLVVEDVLKVFQQGLSARDADTVLSLLTLTFEPKTDGMGRLILTFAGDGAVALDVEAVSVVLQDVTRPYLSTSGKSPTHPE